jgi:hypothetical protein
MKHLLTILLSMMISVNAYSLNIIHSRDCVIHVDKSIKKNFPDAIDDMERLLGDQLYTVKFSNFAEKLPPQTLYMIIKKRMLKRTLFPPCEVTVILNKSEGMGFNPRKDEIIFENMAQRSRPRPTLKGTIRCVYALKDALMGIPKCEKVEAQKK